MRHVWFNYSQQHVPFWYQLFATVHVPHCRHVSSNGGGGIRMDGWMPQTATLDPALLMYIRYVCTRTRACYPNVPIDRCVTPSAFTALSAKQSDEETSDGLDGQDASRPLSGDSEAFPGVEQAPTQGRPPRRSAPDLSAVREGDLSDLVSYPHC